jgi:hypothetical protein
MSTNALNQVYKTAIVALEQALATGDITQGAVGIPITCDVMTQTPFVAGQTYVVMDDTFAAGANGLPNAERFTLVSITAGTATPKADSIGYTYTGTLVCAALANGYTQAAHARVLIPGIEMSIQSADFNCRFKTLSDAPKIDFDDEASRFATGDEGRDVSIAGARSAEISFTEKLAWAGAVTTVPVWDKLMQIMGHVRKAYGSHGIEYLPLQYANEITATVWVVTPENGMAPNSTVYRYCGVHGGNGSSIGAGKIGDPYMLTGKLNAAYIATMDLTIAHARALTSNYTQVPEILLSNTCTAVAYVNGSLVSKELEISQFSLDFGGVVNPFIDQETATGYAFYVTSDRDPKLTINPYHTRKALDDIDYIVTNMSCGKLTIASAITTPHITIEIFNAQLTSPALGTREGYVNTNRTYRALRNNLGAGAVESTVPDGAMYGILIGARS